MRASLVLGAALLLFACADRYVPPEEEPGAFLPITDVDSLPGASCSHALMVQVGMPNGRVFCIDRFEAGLAGGGLGNAQQASDDTDTQTDGSTTAQATVALGVTPAGGVSWYQAKAACANAGKRLCTLEEWERACRGPSALIYPYGDTVDDAMCNGFFHFSETNPLPTGSLSGCGSAYGAYDLSGNLAEWTDTAVPRIPGGTVLDDRAVRGGSYTSNANALACVGEEFRAPPGQAASDRGFRCCREP